MMPSDNEMIRGLRRLADFLEAHPDLDAQPVDVAVVIPEYFDLPEAERKQATLDALRGAVRSLKDGAALGEVTKDYGKDLVKAERKFGPHRLRVLAWTHSVCERVKVGETVVPAVEEHTVDVYESNCPPLLLEMDLDGIEAEGGFVPGPRTALGVDDFGNPA